MAVFKGKRWRSESTGRFVKRVTVAKQLRAPRSSISATKAAPLRWVEVTAVVRIKIGKRYVESVARQALYQPTRQQIANAKRLVRERVISQVEKEVKRKKVTDKAVEQLKRERLLKGGRYKKVVGLEVRRRARRSKRAQHTEVRDEAEVSEGEAEESEDVYE